MIMFYIRNHKMCYKGEQPRMEKIAGGESAGRSLLAAKPEDRGVSAP